MSFLILPRKKKEAEAETKRLQEERKLAYEVRVRQGQVRAVVQWLLFVQTTGQERAGARRR